MSMTEVIKFLTQKIDSFDQNLNVLNDFSL